MHQGCIVEVQDTKTLIESPMHAYTKKLLAALPKTEDLWTVNTSRKYREKLS